MKPRHLLLPPLLAAVLLSTFSCKKTDHPDAPQGHIPEYVTTTVTGRVTDSDNKPISGATVKAGLATTTTDMDGRFSFSNINIDKKAAAVTVEKAGYFKSVKTAVAGTSSGNQVAIRLIQKTVAGSFAGTNGGAVTVPDAGGSVNFQANSIVDKTTGVPYTGTVAISAFFINPEAAAFRDIIPGTLVGVNSNNQEMGLQSFGMLAVELTGADGQPLQIASGKKAKLSFPIGTTLQKEAPATIPLWYLDEVTGLWKEEGIATRVGNEYVGEVSHFSFWNCDAPFPIANFKAIIHNLQGQTVSGAEVVITAPSPYDTTGSISGSGYTNVEGVIEGNLPLNKALRIRVYDKCGSVLYDQKIGPFNSSTNLGTITLNAQTNPVTFTGKVNNCQGTPVNNGYVSIDLDGMFYNAPVKNGSFTTTIPRCVANATTAKLTAFDLTEETYGAPNEVSVSGNAVNGGTLVACGTSLKTYVRYYLGGVYYELKAPDSIIGSRSGSFAGFLGKRQNAAAEEIVMLFSLKNETPEINPMTFVAVMQNGTYYHKYAQMNTVLTQFGPSGGGYVTGSFGGIIRDSANEKDISVQCEFNFQR